VCLRFPGKITVRKKQPAGIAWNFFGDYTKITLQTENSRQENLKKAKGKKGLQDVCFSKGRGLSVKDMCRSNWVYK